MRTWIGAAPTRRRLLPPFPCRLRAFWMHRKPVVALTARKAPGTGNNPHLGVVFSSFGPNPPLDSGFIQQSGSESQTLKKQESLLFTIGEAGLKPQDSYSLNTLTTSLAAAIAGALGFAFESALGNRFSQTWEFYAITLSLYLVLAYPGFVYRYLFKRHPRLRA